MHRIHKSFTSQEEPKNTLGKSKFSTISLPTPLVEEVERIVLEFKYWPTKTDFVREAVLEKLKMYKKERRQSEESATSGT